MFLQFGVTGVGMQGTMKSNIELVLILEKGKSVNILNKIEQIYEEQIDKSFEWNQLYPLNRSTEQLDPAQ